MFWSASTQTLALNLDRVGVNLFRKVSDFPLIGFFSKNPSCVIVGISVRSVKPSRHAICSLRSRSVAVS